jgi:hypothetical protein
MTQLGPAPIPIGVLARIRGAWDAFVPLGYEDGSGFHFGVPADEVGSKSVLQP